MKEDSMMTRRCPRIDALAIAWIALVPLSANAAELAVQGAKFTIDGKPAFLLGISYYGALGASPATIERDLDDVQRLGFNWIRVWATWSGFKNNVSAVDAEGGPREPYLAGLKRLVADCDRRGMIVDVTLSRGDGIAGSPRLQALAAHRRAVETLVSAMKDRRNWYLDLANERDVRDKRYVSFEELKQLRDAARQLDPKRLITASHAGDLTPRDIREYLDVVRVDFLSPHGQRDSKVAKGVESQVRQYLAWIKEHGRVVPVHYQEPFRRGYTRGWEPSAEDFVTAAVGARNGGAAGWCFHNGDQRGTPDGRPRRSFDLGEKRLFEQLDEVEQETVRELHRAFSITRGQKP
jgi:hypothetical protein